MTPSPIARTGAGSAPGLAGVAGQQIPTTPTGQTYHELQWAYDHFNGALFEARLPACLITLQREKSSAGYFSSKRFAHAEGQITDEIALNPAYFAVMPLVETLATLVHEMCHLWQSHFGQPGRGRYHNEQWAARMESLGLMPSSTGKPGGRRTGDQMADYAIEGGPFLAACAALMTEQFTLSWYDRFPALGQIACGLSSLGQSLPEDVGGGQAPAQHNSALARAMARPAGAFAAPGTGDHMGGQDRQTGQASAANRCNRIKYSCTGQCRSNVWGKPGLALICATCHAPFTPQSQLPP